MKVFMLGWEFPPFISGGLGTACQGLTEALAASGTEVLFVLPNGQVRMGKRGEQSGQVFRTFEHVPNVQLVAVPLCVSGAYSRPPEVAAGRTELGVSAGTLIGDPDVQVRGFSPRYTGDLLRQVEVYARLCLGVARRERFAFNVVHAHDWTAFPAGMAVAAASGKPLVAHVHSTEFDRAGEHVSQPVYEIERAGVHRADAVVAVSRLTRDALVHRYAVAPGKVDVVYNGVRRTAPVNLRRAKGPHEDRVVLFLGRVTMQKGPEYFVAAAKRVMEAIENVKFIIAGTGDLWRRTVELAAEMGIGHRVLFAGFLNGADVLRAFRMADLYVMPSVSEPFGIAPLEAASQHVPVIVSKSSGVAEVLRHALMVDFWDVDEIANKIIGVLRHPPLADVLRVNAFAETLELTWDRAARACHRTYTRLVTA